MDKPRASVLARFYTRKNIMIVASVAVLLVSGLFRIFAPGVTDSSAIPVPGSTTKWTLLSALTAMLKRIRGISLMLHYTAGTGRLHTFSVHINDEREGR